MMPVFENSQNNIASVGQLAQIRTYYNDTEEFQSPKLESAVKQPRQIHTCLLILNTIFLVSLIVCLSLVKRYYFMPFIVGELIVMPFIIYVLLSIITEPLKVYVRNMKDVNAMNQIYEELRQRTGHLKLTVQCFHYTGGKNRRKEVTHTAVEMVPIQVCVDQSENLNALNQIGKYMFCKINKCFYFGDNNSQIMFTDLMSRFKALNTRDTEQTWTHTLDVTIPGFENQIGVCASGTGGYLRPLFFIFTFLGLGYPYLMAVECNATRYQINSIKRLTL